MDTPAEASARSSQDVNQRSETSNEPNRQATGTEGEPEEGNKFLQAVSAWRNVDLSALIPSLDNVAAELASQQRDSMTQRKELADKTKAFRRMDDAGKLVEVKALLKAYQTYIDVITTQSKSASAAFFRAYSPLSEVPDPYPLLEASIDSLVTAEETVPRLTEENERLQRSVKSLTAQVDRSEKQLDHERSARQTSEKTRESKIQEVEKSWSAVLKEKEDNWASKEKALEDKADNLERVLKEVKATYEVSQRLGQNDDDAGKGGATAAELEIVSSELDRTSMRLAEVEARNEQLRVELAQSASHNKEPTSIEDDPVFLRLQSDNASLVRKLESSKFDKDSPEGKWSSQHKALERDLASLKNERDSLREKVKKWSDYESVKQELEVLKSIEFSIGEDDEIDKGGVDEQALSSNGSAAKSKGETLEQLLLSRNKKLNNELTVLRVSHQDLQARLETMQNEFSETNMELEKSRNLTAKLETDLENIQQEAAATLPLRSSRAADLYSKNRAQSTYGGTRGGRGSPTSSIISGFDPQVRAGTPPTDSLRPSDASSGGGILPMVTAQRDRFKQKNSELEGELQRTYQTVTSLRTEVASLQKDNLNLYEKTRYVSTFGHRNPSLHAPGTSSSGIDSRYQSAYEQSLSPFAQFRGRESARAFKRMSLPERVVYQVTRMVLATRTSRNLFAAYCLALHLLVLFMLYYAGTTGIEANASNLSDNTAAAAAAAGAAGGGAHDDHGDWEHENFKDG